MKILGDLNCVICMFPFCVLESETQAASSEKAGTEA